VAAPAPTPDRSKTPAKGCSQVAGNRHGCLLRADAFAKGLAPGLGAIIEPTLRVLEAMRAQLLVYIAEIQACGVRVLRNIVQCLCDKFDSSSTVRFGSD
jgi:hypothetical protein